MSLHTLAHHLQSAGRGDDKVLVHMTPKEVGGLQSLAMAHGGSLTINPQTGLPEAGFLKSLLPMLAGGALTVLSGGTLSPLLAAGIVGGGTALATGSLEKGLMAGLGAYGGAGLGAGLTSAGTAQAAVNAAPAASTAAPIAQAGAASGTPLAGAVQNAQALNAAQAAQSAITPTASNALQTAASTAANASPGAAAMQGIQALGTQGGRAAFSAGVNAAAPRAAQAGLMSMAMQPPPTVSGGGKKDQGMIRPYEFIREKTPEASGAPRGNVWDGPVSSKERDYFTDKMVAHTPYMAPGPEYNKKGGVDMFSWMNSDPKAADAYLAQQAAAKNAGSTPPPDVPNNPMDPRYQAWLKSQQTPQLMGGLGMATGGLAKGGISHLGDYSDGGRLLKGPGDGVSDSIPAVIGNRQPARLADGEFVVPARIVSELGNGSTEAGARKLYAMMDRVQKARRKTVGKDRVARDTNAEKHLPA